jgi:hypothetical protein
MTAKALGLIEAIGLAAAIEAADAAAKAANVVVLGYENARGGGRITVKLAGDVGAVKSAVAAGSAAALRVGRVDGCVVIPRPHEEIEALIARIDRGRRAQAPAPPPLSALAPLSLAPEPAPAPEPEPAAAAAAEPVAETPEPAAVAAAEPVAETPEPAEPVLAPQPPASPGPEKDGPAAARRSKQARRNTTPTPGSGEVEGQ